MAVYHKFYIGYILTQCLILAENDLKCVQDNSISTFLEFNKYMKECQTILDTVIKRLPLNANADYIGCFKYSGMSLGVYPTSDSTKISIEKCIYKCQNYHLSYAGITNGTQCLCANKEESFIQINEMNCSVECPIDFRLYCGGDKAIQLYKTKIIKNNGVQRIETGKYLGCFEEGLRPLLSGNVSVSTHTMINSCLGFCEKTRSFYAGLKRMNICLCGNDTIKINASSDAHCQLRCAGNLSQSCGGLYHLQLYKTSIPLPTRFPHWHRKASYSGCYFKEEKDHLLLVMKLFSAMTLELCLSTCEQFGIRYSGVQGEQCFCGASLPKTPLVADFNCDHICTGNPSQFCGGQGLNSVRFVQVYEIEDSSQFISTEGMFLGCYIGKIEDLQQMKYVADNNNINIDVCLTSCQQERLKFAAIGNGSQCACGQLYDNLRKTSSMECDLPCKGNMNQACGGTNRIQIHSKKIFPRRFTPYGIYLGCFMSFPFTNALESQKMTLNLCVEHCWENGFLYAALYQGNKCFCNKYGSDNSYKVFEDHCDYQCSSNDLNFCGGARTFQIYHVEYLLRKAFAQSSISLPTDLTWDLTGQPSE